MYHISCTVLWCVPYLLYGTVQLGGEAAQPSRPPEPRIQVGPLSLPANILDQVLHCAVLLDLYCTGAVQVLSEKKMALLEDPDVVAFLRQHGVKQ